MIRKLITTILRQLNSPSLEETACATGGAHEWEPCDCNYECDASYCPNCETFR